MIEGLLSADLHCKPLLHHHCDCNATGLLLRRHWAGTAKVLVQHCHAIALTLPFRHCLVIVLLLGSIHRKCSEVGTPLHCFRTATDVSMARRQRFCRRIVLRLPSLHWHRVNSALAGPTLAQDCHGTVYSPHCELSLQCHCDCLATGLLLLRHWAGAAEVLGSHRASIAMRLHWH